MQVNRAFGGRSNLANQLQQRALTSAVFADNPKRLTLFNSQVNAVKSVKSFVGINTNFSVRVILAMFDGPSTLQITPKRTAANFTKPILFPDTRNLNCYVVLLAH